ncbi:hypothetical protein CEXT_204221 [Caerostris extrusa]|uniref:Uncharacterized protein n=1 Tax=Caerostris extrusa TaxID=172846 RepID=A0AAV4UT56_CAEEX|nr:hypothetical protein CEXT_204221 [Caerostris extrusa]
MLSTHFAVRYFYCPGMAVRSPPRYMTCISGPRTHCHCVLSTQIMGAQFSCDRTTGVVSPFSILLAKGHNCINFRPYRFIKFRMLAGGGRAVVCWQAGYIKCFLV